MIGITRYSHIMAFLAKLEWVFASINHVQHLVHFGHQQSPGQGGIHLQEQEENFKKSLYG